MELFQALSREFSASYEEVYNLLVRNRFVVVMIRWTGLVTSNPAPVPGAVAGVFGLV